VTVLDVDLRPPHRVRAARKTRAQRDHDLVGTARRDERLPLDDGLAGEEHVGAVGEVDGLVEDEAHLARRRLDDRAGGRLRPDEQRMRAGRCGEDERAAENGRDERDSAHPAASVTTHRP
jgi:hypothetical protein